MDPVTLQLLIKAGAPVVLAIIQLFRDRGLKDDADELAAALSRAEVNFDLVIERGTSDSAPEPGSIDEGRR